VAFRWRSFKEIVRLWVDLFDRHNLLAYASAIALRMFIAAVACALFALGILGAAHEQQLWHETIGPPIKPKVLPDVFAGINQTVDHVFSSSSAALLALASALAVWEVSGIIRAAIGALDEIYETPETRPFWIRFPLSFGLAILVLCAMLGAVAIVWAGHVSGSFGLPILILRWPAAVALVAFAFELIVRWAPAEHRRVRALDEPRHSVRRGRLDRRDTECCSSRWSSTSSFGPTRSGRAPSSSSCRSSRV